MKMSISVLRVALDALLGSLEIRDSVDDPTWNYSWDNRKKAAKLLDDLINSVIVSLSVEEDSK